IPANTATGSRSRSCSPSRPRTSSGAAAGTITTPCTSSTGRSCATTSGWSAAADRATATTLLIARRHAQLCMESDRTARRDGRLQMRERAVPGPGGIGETLQQVAARLARAGDRDAVLFYHRDSEVRWSFAELGARVDRLAA